MKTLLLIAITILLVLILKEIKNVDFRVKNIENNISVLKH